jgi:hypothetical protein
MVAFNLLAQDYQMLLDGQQILDVTGTFKLNMVHDDVIEAFDADDDEFEIAMEITDTQNINLNGRNIVILRGIEFDYTDEYDSEA